MCCLCLTGDEQIPQTTMDLYFVYGHCHDSDGRLVLGRSEWGFK